MLVDRVDRERWLAAAPPLLLLLLLLVLVHGVRRHECWFQRSVSMPSNVSTPSTWLCRSFTLFELNWSSRQQTTN